MITNTTIESQINTEQTRHIFNQTPIFVPAVLITSLSTMLMLWKTTLPVIAIIWCAWIWLLYGGFWVLYRYWKEAQPTGDKMKIWARRYIFLSWIATASWGMIGILFYHPDSFIYQLLLIVILVVGAAAITATSTAYSPTFYPVVLMLLPLSIRFFFEEERIYLLLALSLIVVTALMFFLHRNSHAFYAAALRLRFENEALVNKLALQKNVAERANADKSTFLATVSHDLRQPLHAMSLFCGELKICQHEAEKREKLISRLNESILAMQNIFNGLLDISRFEVGVIKPNISQFTLDELFASLFDDYSLKAQKKGLVLRCVFSRIEVETDFMLLRRIVANLLENAIRYTQKGKVLLGVRRQLSSVSLQIWDTGIGIPAEDVDKIFNVFEQLNQSKTTLDTGVGLGLSVVKQLSASLNYQLSLRSVVGKGTVFELNIPLQSQLKNIFEVKV